MNTRQTRRISAFTLIELLTVIAIIALLAAILFPVFAQVREQTRQSNTFSNMHSVYVGAKLFYEDEKRFPPTLFPYSELSFTPTPAPPCVNTRPSMPGDFSGNQLNSDGTYETSVPFDRATGYFAESPDCTSVNRGYLYGEQVKDYRAFTCTDNTINDKLKVTKAYYPASVKSYKNGQPVEVDWQLADPTNPASNGDPDLPDVPNRASGTQSPYVGAAKMFYVMDSMDIGPALNADGTPMYYPGTKNVIYELHYTPDWTHELGAADDIDVNGKPIVTQLKYKNPPTERTVITYVTHHAATAHNTDVLVLLDSGTAKKIDAKKAAAELPLHYQP